MKLRDIFNKLWSNLPWREDRRQYYALRDAIRAGNLDAAKEALKAGAKANYYPASIKNRPLRQALQQGNPLLFQMLLDHGAQLHGLSIYDLRIDHKKNEHKIWDVSFLYAAIEQNNEDIALIIANHPGIDPRVSGHLEDFHERSSLLDRAPYPVKPVDFAKEKGMKRLVAVLEEKMLIWEKREAPQVARDQEREARRLLDQAAALRKQAEALEKKAGQVRQSLPAP